MFLISIKYSFKKINVSFQTIHCLILYLDRCLYSSLKKKDQHLFNINHAYQTLKKYMQCKIKIPFNEKKKSKNLSIKIRIGRKLLRSSTAITRKPPSGPFDLTRARQKPAIAKATYTCTTSVSR